MKRNKKIIDFSTIFIGVAIMAMLLVIASANYRFFYGEMNESLYFRLNIISITLITFFTILFFTKNQTRVNALIISFSLVVGVYIVEIFLHVYYFGTIQAQKEEKFQNYDYRTFYEVLEDFSKESREVFPRIAPVSFLETNGIVGKHGLSQLIPLGGVSNKDTLFCNESGEYIVYKSDQYGFNNDNRVWEPSREKWVLVGDSFTHGACVNRKDNIASVVGSAVEPNVINLGYSGNGPLLNLASIVEYAKKIQPKKIFWLYCEGNDLTDLKKELNNTILNQYMEHNTFSQGLMDKQENINQSLKSYLDLEMSKRKESGDINKQKSVKLTGVDQVKRILRLYNLREKLGLVSYNFFALEEFQKVIKRAKQVVSSWGGELHFVYLPSYLRYVSLIDDHDAYNQKGSVINIVKSANVPVIDMHESVFGKHKDPVGLFPYRINGHYTPEGYRAVSEAILDFVKNN